MFAAVLHASWNAILKRGEDKRLQMTAIAVGHLPFAPIAIYFAPSLDLACWPYLVLGAIFHLGYQYYLVESYKKGDLSQVYPIARASAPLLVTCISALFLNVNLNLEVPVSSNIPLVSYASVEFAGLSPSDKSIVEKSGTVSVLVFVTVVLIVLEPGTTE